MERVAKAVSDCFANIETRLDELTLYFSILLDKLHISCEVISSNKWNTSMNGRNVTYEGGFHFDDHDKSNCGDNDEMPILQDNSFGTNLEPQEMRFSSLFLTTLEECLESAGFKHKIAQTIPVESSLMSAQMVHIQGDIHKTLGTGKPLSALSPLRYVVY